MKVLTLYTFDRYHYTIVLEVLRGVETMSEEVFLFD